MDIKNREQDDTLFASNKTGSHKLKLFIVGKSKNSRILKNVNWKNLPVIYKSLKNAWMTQALFKKMVFK